MNKTILAIAIIGINFTGCVGTVVANNDVKKDSSSTVQNAKGTVKQDENVTKTTPKKVIYKSLK